MGLINKGLFERMGLIRENGAYQREWGLLIRAYSREWVLLERRGHIRENGASQRE